MSPETLTALFVALGEVVAAIREVLTRKRQDHATAALPAAEATEAHIKQLIAEALERAKSRQPLPVSPQGAGPHLAAGAEELKAHIDALVADALAREHRRAAAVPGATTAAASEPAPPAAGAATPEPAVGGGAEAGGTVEHGPTVP